MLLTITYAGRDEGKLEPCVSVLYKQISSSTQFPYIAVLMCSHDKILRNNGNICMLMHSNKVPIKSCFNEDTSKGRFSEHLESI